MTNISEQFVIDHIIAEGGMPEILEALTLVRLYLKTDHYAAKNKRLNEWDPHPADVHDIIIAVFTITLIDESTIYQAIIGRLQHMIQVEDSIDRFKILADVIGLISNTGLIDITSPGQGQHITITTEYEILDIPVPEKHVIVIDQPQPIESNWDEEHGSMLLGHAMNHHEQEICLDHLNRLNQIPLKLNAAFVKMYKEEPKHKPETKKAQNRWHQFMHESFEKYTELVAHGKPFYLIHKYDTRGRTYACGYHVTSQGNSYKKAIVELANEELVI